MEANAPDFRPSGLLAAESNQKNGIALKYHEPPEARKPKHNWRVYVFKDGQEQGKYIAAHYKLLPQISYFDLLLTINAAVCFASIL